MQCSGVKRDDCKHELKHLLLMDDRQDFEHADDNAVHPPTKWKAAAWKEPQSPHLTIKGGWDLTCESQTTQRWRMVQHQSMKYARFPTSKWATFWLRMWWDQGQSSQSLTTKPRANKKSGNVTYSHHIASRLKESSCRIQWNEFERRLAVESRYNKPDPTLIRLDLLSKCQRQVKKRHQRQRRNSSKRVLTNCIPW